jgi:putative heme iron utilization protein
LTYNQKRSKIAKDVINRQMGGLMSENNQDNILQDFIDGFKSLTLSTIDEQNLPFTSYAPFIKNDHKYYIYISSIAKHFHNLEKHKNASLFFIEDEKDCENIFARKRVTLQCNVKKLSRDTKDFEDLMDIFQKKHGDMISKLRSFNDFYIHEFEPVCGQAVFGFGQAYDIGGYQCTELLTRKVEHGHKS